jgi:hypothetical protein
MSPRGASGRPSADHPEEALSAVTVQTHGCRECAGTVVATSREGRRPRLLGVIVRRPARQDLALNLSAKRRLCNTVGGRGIEGSTRSSAISIARSRAAATTNLARPNQSWVLRVLFARVKGCALIKVFMICPPWRLSRPRQNSAPGSRPSHG